MDKEEKYWSNLEKLYVHNVYEKISHRYDEFLKLSQIASNSRQTSCEWGDCDESSDADNSNGNNNTNTNNDNNDTKNDNQNVTHHHQHHSHHHSHSHHNLNHHHYHHNHHHQNQYEHTTNGIGRHVNHHLKLDLDSIDNSGTINKQHHNLKGVKNVRHHSKHNPWPKVKSFLLQLERYSLIADVGCGDGKYLNVNNRILSIGSDRSVSLCKLSSLKHPPIQSVTNQNQIVICDNLALPFKSNYFDAVISIGVIHHFSTEKRRIQAIQELTRILRPGGKIMIYVWALEQKLRKFNSQDVLVPMIDASRVNMLKSEGDFKYKLRRDLSNNSTAESEDSTSEDVFEKSFKMSKSPLNDNAQNNDNITRLSSEQIQTQGKTDEEAATRSPNFVENMRRFFARKFQLGNSSCDSEKKSASTPTNELSLVENDTKEELSCPFSPSDLNQPPKSQQQHRLQQQQQQQQHDPIIERYKQIIDEHKHTLPENFTIRRFPSSSCADTFGDDQELTPKQLSFIPIICDKSDVKFQHILLKVENINLIDNKYKLKSLINGSNINENENLNSTSNNNNNNNNSNINCSSDVTTSSPSLTPSPINQYAPPTSSSTTNPNVDEDDVFLNASSRSDDQDSSNGHSPSPSPSRQPLSLDTSMAAATVAQTTPNGFAEFLDELNVSNKRFYHVFRRDELDELIKHNCSSLAIYKSFYDHGNWCICAIKEA